MSCRELYALLTLCHIIASRNTELADNAKRTLQKESDGCSLSSLTVDLTDMDSVRAFADTVKHSFAKGEIDVLISKTSGRNFLIDHDPLFIYFLPPADNAGIMNTAYMCTKDGLESQCQTVNTKEGKNRICVLTCTMLENCAELYSTIFTCAIIITMDKPSNWTNTLCSKFNRVRYL